MASISGRTLSLELAQIALDIAGIADPTPISDGASMLIAFATKDYWGGAMSAVSMIPYVGDLAKAGKFPKYLKTLESAVAAAADSADTAKLLAPIMRRIQEALDLLPFSAGPQVARMRSLVNDFFTTSKLPRATKRFLPDISTQFKFRKFSQGGYNYHEGVGRLGVPGHVLTHRNPAAQSSLSSGLGDDAGHLIGNRFGAAGGLENLGLQNWKTNRFGSYKLLENQWEQKLKQGYGVEVLVRDVTKVGESRPFARKVKWNEIDPQGGVTSHELTFMNAHTERSRTMQEIPPTVLEPQTDNVIWVDFTARRR